MPTTNGPTISKFQAAFKGGARPNRFSVVFTGTRKLDDLTVYHCKGASQPASTLGETIAPYMGRQYKFPGDRTFDDWTVTFMNDNEHKLRNELETWHESMLGYETNVGSSEMTDHLGDATVTQFDRNNTSIKTYQLLGIWPKEVGAIELSWDNNDAIEEFTVTFSINWIEPAGLTAPSGGGGGGG